jgi:hypothetical protein
MLTVKNKKAARPLVDAPLTFGRLILGDRPLRCRELRSNG